ncbi:hypothetical protein [Streptomyces iconiensis]|uniref:Uncharacterized protein n=1 Tax=Streptomyces iconiensis TaxID=1384038 RepID=A0ABT7AAS7_9ACTN|nr:hypothetical protein [Streptomyces iconiensis]MDJ1137921.1 hypothetical protein [Streptomyces iconiensis]
MAGARQIVDSPSVTPLPHGLWDAAQQPTAQGPHWQQGITWSERCPGGTTTYDECLTETGGGTPPPAPATKAATFGQRLRGATPFTVVTEFDCATVGLTDAATVASDALARVEAQQLEAAFWTGSAGGQDVVFPHLAADAEVLDGQDAILQSAASPVVTGAADIATALGVLEQELADCYTGQGVIHIPRSALPTLAAWNLARLVGGRLVTPAGNVLAVGSGYPGTGSDGATPAAGTTWIYATGSVWGYRSEPRVSQPRESLDRASNTYRMLAERTYVIAYDCCLLAAHVKLGVPTE